MKYPLVSVIVTTRNNTTTLNACLLSIQKQTYTPIELVVVDNHSTDDTMEIAKRFTEKVFTKGPERSTQRNFAVKKSSGKYVLIIDSDMELSERVVAACINEVEQHPEQKALIIPEESFGEGFWAQCKRLERSFYIGIPWIEAARFFDKELYIETGGYNEALISGEDWDLSQRIQTATKVGRISDFIFHNEGRLRLGTSLRKKFYYAKKFSAYIAGNTNSSAVQAQTGLFHRYKLFFSHPKLLLKNPVQGFGMLFMKTCEFGVGACGYLLAKRGQVNE